jgi:trans-aconitate methyltransferase
MTSLEALINDLDSFSRALGDINYSCEKERFKKQMERLWQYIRAYSDEQTVQQFLQSERFPLFRKEFKAHQDYYERLIEAEEAMVIHSGILKKSMESLLIFAKNTFVIDNYKMVRKEMDMSNMDDAKELVMVGCGPLPETILFLVDNTNISHITGIDASNEATMIAGGILEAMGHSARVTLECAHGETYDFSHADVIHIADAVCNKNAVFQNIAKTAKKGTRILVRNPSHLARVLFSLLTEIPEGMLLEKEEKGDTNFFHVPSLYKKTI